MSKLDWFRQVRGKFQERCRRTGFIPNTLELFIKETIMADIMQVTDGDFEQEILQASTPALVDFWAAWCGPCRAIAPVVEELAKDYAGKVKVAKMNVDENSKTPVKYGIRAIPTLILFKNGNVVDQITGAVSKTQIENAIKKML
jgi:thioredoxin 1